MEPSETASERPLTKLEIQLGLIEAAFGKDFGKEYFTRTGENGRQAAASLLAQARAQHVPGVGPVLRPCDTGDCGDRVACCCGSRHGAAGYYRC